MVNKKAEKKADRGCGGFPRQAEDMTEKKVAQTQFGCEEGGAEGYRDRETLGPNKLFQQQGVQGAARPLVNKKADRGCGGSPRQAEDMTAKKT